MYELSLLCVRKNLKRKALTKIILLKYPLNTRKNVKTCNSNCHFELCMCVRKYAMMIKN